MTDHYIPHNAHNPHLLVLAQQEDVRFANNFSSQIQSTAMLLEDESNFLVLERYIRQLLKYKDFVHTLGPVVLYTAAQEVDGETLLSHHGLLTSGTDASQLKSCTRQLLTHAQRVNRHQDLCQQLHDTVAQLR